jgi:transcriptional regulator with XRE-family HTH domain
VASSPIDPAVARDRFALFVKRALDDARARGMTDREIARVSGVATSTFHRWRTAEARGLPELPKVRAFCQAVGASVEDAMRALGMTDSGPQPTPEPPLPQDVRVILRRLTDPNTPDAQKQFIRMTLQMLAERAYADPRYDYDEKPGEQAG